MMTVSLGPTPRENILAWDHILQTNTQTHLEKRNQRNLKGMCSCLLLSHSLPLPLPLLLSHSFCTLTCTHSHILTHTDAHDPLPPSTKIHTQAHIYHTLRLTDTQLNTHTRTDSTRQIRRAHV